MNPDARDNFRRQAEWRQDLGLAHGDAVVWGGSSRLVFHGVDPVEPGIHPVTGEARYNLTFRRSC